MKYLMVTSFPPTKCGIAAYASQSVKKLRLDGHIVDVLSVDGKGNVDFKLNTIGGIRPLKLLIYTLFYDRVVIQYHPSFFFHRRNRISRYFTSIALSIFFFFCRKAEVVCHEIVYKSDVILRNLERIRWRLVGRVILHTQIEVDTFKKFIGSSSDNKIILRAHHEDFIKYNNVTREMAREEFGISKDSLLFLCIGFIQSSKGFDRAVRAFKRTHNDNAILYIVGSIRTASVENNKYLQKLKELANGYENIKIVEKYLTDEEFDAWIISADYIVIPYEEIASSGVAGRAKLFKKPIIASRVGGLENQQEEGDYLFESDDDLAGVLKHIIENDGFSRGDQGTALTGEKSIIESK